ncbi:MAG: folate-binding protein YgfZ [Gammaproteobacteria bacterium]|nr:folate-binding protein YgfZ [Gammaproteobacteria bacterium]
MQSPFFYQLTQLGFIKITGNDAKKFLQGQLTCDVEKITSTHNTMAAHCNPQGRMISLFYLFLFEEDYYLLMHKSMIKIALSALQKYAVFYKVQLSDASDTFSSMGCLHFTSCKFNNVALINIPSTTQRCLFVGEKKIIEKILQTATQPIYGPQEWHYLDITEALPTLYPETSGKFLPHELKLHEFHAIDFQKGCYTGQEIIARMHYRGKLKNDLYKASIISQLPLLPGTDIYAVENREAHVSGIIVDVYEMTDQSFYTLILVDKVHAKNQTLFLKEENEIFFTMINENEYDN